MELKGVLTRKKDDLPRAEDYMPDKKERKRIINNWNRENPKVDSTPLYAMILIIIFAAISFIAAILAGSALMDESYGVVRVFFLLLGPYLTVWLTLLVVADVAGFPLSIVGAIVWGGTFFFIGSDSALWLFVTALTTAISNGILFTRV